MPGLSQYDRDPDATWEARAARAKKRGGGSKLPDHELRPNYGTEQERREHYERMRELGAPPSTCWCGGELCRSDSSGYDWVGIDEGLPHPRTIEELALRVEKRMDG